MDTAVKSCSRSEKREEARSRSKGGFSLLRAAAAEAAALSQYERECEVVQFRWIFFLWKENFLKTCRRFSSGLVILRVLFFCW